MTVVAKENGRKSDRVVQIMAENYSRRRDCKTSKFRILWSDSVKLVVSSCVVMLGWSKRQWNEEKFDRKSSIGEEFWQNDRRLQAERKLEENSNFDQKFQKLVGGFSSPNIYGDQIKRIVDQL